MRANPYRGYRFPEEIISQCVWLYFNFAVSFREVELMMAFRGVQLSYETIRRWCETLRCIVCCQIEESGGPSSEINGSWTRCFSRSMACSIISGVPFHQHGAVIDILVQPKRDRYAAIRFFRKLLTNQPSADLA